METAIAPPVDQAYQPVPAAVTPVVQPDVQAIPTAPSLEQQGEPKAPAPTSGVEGQPGTSAAAPAFDLDEFLRIKQDYEAVQSKVHEQETLLADIRRLAEEQQAAQAQSQLRAEIQQQVSDLLRKRGVEDDDIASAVAELTYGRLDTTKNAYQQQMETWQSQVQQSYQEGLWAASKDGFAQYLIQEHKLDPVYLPRLKQANSEEQMTLIANTLREAQQLYQQHAYARTVQEQEAQRRASGVDTITGVTSGPTVSEPLKPGRNLDVLSVILSGT